MRDQIIIITKVTNEVLEALEGFDYELMNCSNTLGTSMVAHIGSSSLNDPIFLSKRLKDDSGIVISAGRGSANLINTIRIPSIREMSKENILLATEIEDLARDKLKKSIFNIIALRPELEAKSIEMYEEFSPFGKKEYHTAKNMWKKPLTLSKKARRGVHHLKRNKTKNRKRKG